MWTIKTTTRALALGLLVSPLGILGILGMGACDWGAPTDASKKAEPGKVDAGADNAAEPAKKEAAPQPAEPDAALAVDSSKAAEPTPEACLVGCEQADLSDDDRATCRLRCGGAIAPKHPILGAYLGCYDGCVGKSADDRPTCHKNCAASVTAGTGDPAASACPRGCTEAFGSCLSPCEGKTEDNAATCRKQCEVVAEKCVLACK